MAAPCDNVAREKAEHHTQRNNQQEERDPRTRVLPQRGLSTEDQAGDVEKRAAGGNFELDEVARDRVAFVRLQQPRERVNGAARDRRHHRDPPRLVAHDVPRLARATAS